MVHPTPAELDVLNILWEEGESRIQTVNDRLNKTRPVGYTTTLKIMQIMTEKGLLGRRKEGKSHIYYPLVEQSDTRSSLVERFVASAFDGSRSELAMQLLGSGEISKAELEDIKQFLEKMEREK